MDQQEFNSHPRRTVDKTEVKAIPRITLTLESLSDCAYGLRYHAKLQGFVYNLLKGTSYGSLHDMRGCKNFCFSNIAPPFNMRKGDRRYLIISSPDPGLISAFASSLANAQRFNIGDMLFSLRRARITSPRIGRSASLVTRTPIIIRIPKHSYEKYGISSEYPYVYWRKDLPFDAFLRQLEENLIKKYQGFKKVKLDDSAYLPLFQRFLFKKPVCNHLVIDGREFKVFGSLWEFSFDHLTNEQRELLQFGLDAGLGERNSLGFGFVDPKNQFSGSRKNK